MQWLATLPWGIVIMMCLTLGLAPFTPPHIVEKLGMLSRGELTKAIDIFDLFFHATPWLLLIAKIGVTALGSGEASAPE
ncbi:MAG: RND transporter [Proteobacteria bacterium]|nr:RND transporter [Pseudomonadota bacterium]